MNKKYPCLNCVPTCAKWENNYMCCDTDKTQELMMASQILITIVEVFRFLEDTYCSALSELNIIIEYQKNNTMKNHIINLTIIQIYVSNNSQSQMNVICLKTNVNTLITFEVTVKKFIFVIFSFNPHCYRFDPQYMCILCILKHAIYYS